MVTVEEAKKIVFENIQPTKSVEAKINDALNFVLAKDIFSPIDLPSFNQSSMDGYAINFGNDFDIKEFEIIGEIKAGDDEIFILEIGQAVRIFTGAAVPLSANAIIIQENAEEINGKIIVQSTYKNGDRIRIKGSQIKFGELALTKNTILNPASIGFLAMLGIEKVKVFSKPSISIIITGNEIVAVGSALKNGKIYESNSYMLESALTQMNLKIQNKYFVEDHKNILKRKIEIAINDSEILILTGGISVGKYDFVLEILNELGVKTFYYKIFQKPGKPMFAGKINDTYIFALPGNPASALVCFYEYVFPAIRKMIGIKNFELKKIFLKTINEIKKKEGKAAFIRSKICDDGIVELKEQGSDTLRSFSEADSFIYLHQMKGNVNQNELVEVHLLPVNL